MLEYISIDASKASLYFKKRNDLEACQSKCLEIFCNYKTSSQYPFVKIVVDKIENSFARLISELNCISESYDTLVADEYQKYVENEEVND